MLADGKGLRATSRASGVARVTVEKLLRDLGRVCADYQNRKMWDLPCRRLVCDEIRSFIYAKQRNVGRAQKAPPTAGDIWTWTAMCDDTKLVPTWCVGQRDVATGTAFMRDLTGRLRHRVQLRSDGRGVHLEAVEDAFGSGIGSDLLREAFGIEDSGLERQLSTRHAEGQNSMRMALRRFTGTTGFSKKLEMHVHALALHFMLYNWVQVHQALRATPAMAAEVADRRWEIEDLIKLLEKYEAAEQAATATEQNAALRPGSSSPPLPAGR